MLHFAYAWIFYYEYKYMQTPSILLKATVDKNMRILSSFTHFIYFMTLLLFYNALHVQKEVCPDFWLVLYSNMHWCALPWLHRERQKTHLKKPCCGESFTAQFTNCLRLFVTLPFFPQSLSFSLPVLYTQESFCLEMRWKRQKPPLKNTTLHVCVREREKVRESEREKGRNDIERWTDRKLPDIKTLSSVFCGCTNFYFPQFTRSNAILTVTVKCTWHLWSSAKCSGNYSANKSSHLTDQHFLDL